MKLYNTLSRQVEDFKPLNDNKVRLYTCGLTVYSQPHIGNWLAYIYWDILVRALQSGGYTVDRVQNITDVGHLTSDEDAGEDKMLKGALREGLTAWQVADKYITIADHEAYELLQLIRPNHLPRATDYIPQQIAFIEALEKKGYTNRETRHGMGESFWRWKWRWLPGLASGVLGHGPRITGRPNRHPHRWRRPYSRAS